MDVLSLISTKGGAGKTTVAATLGGVLADAGLRVLLLVLDSQTLSNYYTLYESREAGSYELIAHWLTAPEQVISATVIQNLDLIVSNDRPGYISTLLLHAADGLGVFGEPPCILPLPIRFFAISKTCAMSASCRSAMATIARRATAR